jgi:hypothetical protein
LALEESGLEIDHAKHLQENKTVDVDVFEIEIRKKAKQMTSAYHVIFCLENSIRKLLRDRLIEKHGASWWDAGVPHPVKKKVAGRQKNEKNTPFSERSEDPMYYSDFSDLSKIIENNWDDFSDSFRSLESVTGTLEILNVLRRTVAHNGVLDEDETERLKMHIKDWIRIQM